MSRFTVSTFIERKGSRFLDFFKLGISNALWSYNIPIERDRGNNQPTAYGSPIHQPDGHIPGAVVPPEDIGLAVPIKINIAR